MSESSNFFEESESENIKMEELDKEIIQRFTNIELNQTNLKM